MTSKIARANHRDEHWWAMEIQELPDNSLIWACRRCDKVLLYEPGMMPNKYPVGRCPKRKKEPWGGADRWPKAR